MRTFFFYRPNVRRGQQIHVRRMFRLVLIKRIFVQRVRAIILFRSVAVGHRLPCARVQIVFLRVHVHASELDASVRQVGVVGQVLDDVLNVSGGVRVPVLSELRVSWSFEGSRMRCFQFPMKRSWSILLRTLVFFQLWMLVPVQAYSSFRQFSHRL